MKTVWFYLCSVFCLDEPSYYKLLCAIICENPMARFLSVVSLQCVVTTKFSGMAIPVLYICTFRLIAETILWYLFKSPVTHRLDLI